VATSPATSLRDITREAVGARISAVAIDLFAEHGFDNVTVEEIAAAVGISARSFHRYFPAKEDAVIGDQTRLGQIVCRAFAERPSEEPIWTSLHHAFQAVFAEPEALDERAKRTMRVLNSTASLRARSLEKHLLWARLLTPLVADRLEDDQHHLRAQTLVQASLVCLDVTLTTWAEDGQTATVKELLAQSFATLSPTSG
jgi:AcrR family transcriptional regulator